MSQKIRHKLERYIDWERSVIMDHTQGLVRLATHNGTWGTTGDMLGWDIRTLGYFGIHRASDGADLAFVSPYTLTGRDLRYSCVEATVKWNGVLKNPIAGRRQERRLVTSGTKVPVLSGFSTLIVKVSVNSPNNKHKFSVNRTLFEAQRAGVEDEGLDVIMGTHDVVIDSNEAALEIAHLFYKDIFSGGLK